MNTIASEARSARIFIAMVGLAAVICTVMYLIGSGWKEQDHDERADAVKQVLSAVHEQRTPSGTWVQLEDGTAHCEWLLAETLEAWAKRASMAAELSDSINKRIPR